MIFVILGLSTALAGVAAGLFIGWEFATWGDDRAPLDVAYWKGYWDGHDTASEVQGRRA